MTKIAGITVALVLAATSLSAGDELAIGGKAPAFELVNAADGSTVAMKPDDGFPKVVVFTSNVCPDAIAFEPRLLEIANRFGHRGARMYAINPNDAATSPAESLAAMQARAVEAGYPFPYLKDRDGSVARAYGARVTPLVLVVDGDGTLIYRGAIDDSPNPVERRTTGLTDALNAMMNGREVAAPVTPEHGCAIE